MVHKLQKIDGGLALVLDPSELESAGFGPDTPLNVSIRGGQILVEAAECSAEFEAVLEDINQRYGEALRRLAE